MNRPAYFILLFSSIAGAFLVGTLYNHRAAAGSRSTEGRRILYYRDPMHPAYRSDKPGTAPDCGMALVPVYADAGAMSGRMLPVGAVKVTPEADRILNIQTVEVREGPFSGALRTLGRVAADENRIYPVAMKTE